MDWWSERVFVRKYFFIRIKSNFRMSLKFNKIFQFILIIYLSVIFRQLYYFGIFIDKSIYSSKQLKYHFINSFLIYKEEFLLGFLSLLLLTLPYLVIFYRKKRPIYLKLIIPLILSILIGYLLITLTSVTWYSGRTWKLNEYLNNTLIIAIPYLIIYFGLEFIYKK